MLKPSIDFSQLERNSRRVIQESDFSQRKRAILHEIVRWSFERGREWATFETLDDLVAITGIHKPDVSDAISELQRAGMINVKRVRASRLAGQTQSIEIRFLPHGALAPAPSKVDGAAAAQVREKLELLNSIPDGFEPSGQGRLPLPPSAEEAVENELASNSLASVVSESLTKPPESGRGVSKSLTRMVSKSLISRSSAPPRARHDHGNDNGTKHEHDHAESTLGNIVSRAAGDDNVDAPEVGESQEGELTPAQADLLDQIHELTEYEQPELYATTWRRRLRSGPKAENAAFRAIGHVRMMKRQGEIKKTIGGALNYYFKLFLGIQYPERRSLPRG